MSVSFPHEEERILAQWTVGASHSTRPSSTNAFLQRIDAFQRQLELSANKKPYTFYDGPPFATGTPHYGHLLASTIKDIIPRYWSMKGHHVERRFGWDTHGACKTHYTATKSLHLTECRCAH
jgi:isoleucyl-tRNA synthetase